MIAALLQPGLEARLVEVDASAAIMRIAERDFTRVGFWPAFGQRCMVIADLGSDQRLNPVANAVADPGGNEGVAVRGAAFVVAWNLDDEGHMGSLSELQIAAIAEHCSFAVAA